MRHTSVEEYYCENAQQAQGLGLGQVQGLLFSAGAAAAAASQRDTCSHTCSSTCTSRPLTAHCVADLAGGRTVSRDVPLPNAVTAAVGQPVPEPVSKRLPDGVQLVLNPPSQRGRRIPTPTPTPTRLTRRGEDIDLTQPKPNIDLTQLLARAESAGRRPQHLRQANNYETVPEKCRPGDRHAQLEYAQRYGAGIAGRVAVCERRGGRGRCMSAGKTRNCTWRRWRRTS